MQASGHGGAADAAQASLLVDVTRMPEGAFGYVPTPALVAPIEFTMALSRYEALGGYLDAVQPLGAVLQRPDVETVAWNEDNPWPGTPPVGAMA